MNTQAPLIDERPRLLSKSQKRLLAMISGLVLTVGSAIAAPGPATPTSASPNRLIQGSTVDIDIVGTSTNNSAFKATAKKVDISAHFSGAGIVVNSITNVTATTLTLNVTVAADAAVGDRSLTITNPDGQTATSSGDIVRVVDIPVITSASISPAAPNCIDPLVAAVGSVTNLDGSPITFTYEWRENHVANGYSTGTLPGSATGGGKSYSCIITPRKDAISGSPFTVGPVLIPIDSTNNGIKDEWEAQYFGSVSISPDADADGDGLSNRAEFLFGLNPVDKESNRVIKSELSKGTGKFSYSRSLVAGATYKVWTSTNLSIWAEQSGLSESQVSSTSDGEVVEVQLPATLTSNSKLFIRVSAE